jgi:hypothetical protein
LYRSRSFASVWVADGNFKAAATYPIDANNGRTHIAAYLVRAGRRTVRRSTSAVASDVHNAVPIDNLLTNKRNDCRFRKGIGWWGGGDLAGDTLLHAFDPFDHCQQDCLMAAPSVKMTVTAARTYLSNCILSHNIKATQPDE